MDASDVAWLSNAPSTASRDAGDVVHTFTAAEIRSLYLACGRILFDQILMTALFVRRPVPPGGAAVPRQACVPLASGAGGPASHATQDGPPARNLRWPETGPQGEVVVGPELVTVEKGNVRMAKGFVRRSLAPSRPTACPPFSNS